jgi:hypothetical protein
MYVHQHRKKARSAWGENYAEMRSAPVATRIASCRANRLELVRSQLWRGPDYANVFR